jgi:hypothetical protein
MGGSPKALRGPSRLSGCGPWCGPMASGEPGICYHLRRSRLMSDISPDLTVSRMKVHVFRNFRFAIPAAMYRLALVATVAGLLAIAVSYSRDGNVSTEATEHGSKLAFQQPKDREQAAGRFIPTPNMPQISEDKGIEIANAFPLPRQRPTTPGFYYEMVRAQGDGAEGEYVLTPRRCTPNVDMPEPCYLPERGRQDFPLRRE